MAEKLSDQECCFCKQIFPGSSIHNHVKTHWLEEKHQKHGRIGNADILRAFKEVSNNDQYISVRLQSLV